MRAATRDLFEREAKAVIRYVELALEPGTSQAEMVSLLKLGRRRLADAASIATPLDVEDVPGDSQHPLGVLAESAE